MKILQGILSESKEYYMDAKGKTEKKLAIKRSEGRKWERTFRFYKATGRIGI